MKKKRSVGVTLIGTLEIIVGIISGIVIGYIYLLLLFLNKGGMSQSDTIWFTVYNLIYLLPVALSIICGSGLLKLNAWARKINITVYPIIALLGYGLLFAGYIFNPIGAGPLPTLSAISFVILVIALALKIFYLTRPKVKEQFG